MRPEERDSAFLWDMLDAAQMTAGLVSGVRVDEFLRDRKLQLAVERTVEIIGEAARNVSESSRTAHPEIPWKSIVAMRNVLAHEYGEVKQDRMWILASVRIPELITALKRIVPPVPPESP